MCKKKKLTFHYGHRGFQIEGLIVISGFKAVIRTTDYQPI